MEEKGGDEKVTEIFFWEVKNESLNQGYACCPLKVMGRNLGDLFKRCFQNLIWKFDPPTIFIFFTLHL